MLTRRRALKKFEQYLLQRNLSKTYIPYIKILFNNLNQNKISLFDLTEAELFSFLSRYEINTKNLFIKALKKYAICFNIKTPLTIALFNKDIKLIKPSVKIKDYPTEDEIRNKILPKLSDKERVVIGFLLATGLRKKEFITLTRDRIDLAKKIAVVWGKGRKERAVTFSKSIADEVSKLFNQEPECKNAFNFSIGKLRGLCKRITRELQMKITPHSYRHTFAISCYNKGLDLKTISELLGHESVDTTMIYLNEKNERAIERYHSVMG
jgi:integrase